MITRRRANLAFFGGLAATAAPGALALAQGREPAAPQNERDAIKAMAGEYLVRFEMRETAAFVDGYKPIAPQTSGGHEVIRVIRDEPRNLSLQHLLVAEHGGQTMIIKHWRQDWVYEPREVLTYEALNQWALKPVPPEEARGAWSQTVWQTDDSPRYGGVGRWRFDLGVTAWQADARRPLARRDAVRNPPYDRYEGFNRHALTPTGWVHEQGNAKVGRKDGRDRVFVHEVVLNRYDRFDDFKVSAADQYWDATREYWAGVRSAWDEAFRRGGGVVRVIEEADMGSVTSPVLMGLADEIAEKKLTTSAALAQARAAIARANQTQSA